MRVEAVVARCEVLTRYLVGQSGAGGGGRWGGVGGGVGVVGTKTTSQDIWELNPRPRRYESLVLATTHV